jgi:hypothetical protein
MGTVIRWKHNLDGQPIGRANANQILDTHLYEVQFPDRHVEEYTANIIAKIYIR